MLILDTEIERIINDTKNLRIALRSRYGDSVEEIHITYNEYEHFYNINAKTSLNGFPNTNTLHVDDMGMVIGYRCNCRWCDEYSGCAHLALVMMKLEELNPEEFPYHYKDEMRQLAIVDFMRKQEERRIQMERERRFDQANQFITKRKQAYELEISSLIQQNVYEIEPVFSSSQYSTIPELSFKVGDDKKYVIKDIDDFLTLTHRGLFHNYGAKLGFIHKLEAFEEFSQVQISFMKYARSNDSYGYHTNKKSIYLTEELIDDFYALYQKNENLDANFRLLEEQKKIAIKIVDEDDHYAVSIRLPRFDMMGVKHLYSFEMKGKIHYITRIPFDEQGHVVDLCNRLYRDDLWIKKDAYGDFYKYTLSDILPYITLTSPVNLTTPTNDGYIKLLGDIDEAEQVSIILEYENQEDGKRYGFQEDTFANTLTQDMVETFIKQYANIIDYDAHIAYMDANEDKTYEFLKEGLPYLGEYCDIYVSNALQAIGSNNSYAISVGVKIENNLLEIDMNSIDIPKNELSDVLKAYRKKKKFHRLKNGKLLYLDAHDLEEVDQFMMDYNIHTDQIKNGTITMNAYRSFAVDGSLEDAHHLNIKREKSFHDVIERFHTNERSTVNLPQPFVHILRDYQKEGYQWLHLLHSYGFNGILADDMGLGKTLQVIALLESMASTDHTSLVVCPSSLIYNWEEEIHKFSNTLRCACVCGNRAERKAMIKTAKDVDILVTSYDYIRRDVDIYEDVSFFYVILDEAQYIKNQKTKNATTVKAIKSEHRLALSGTPIENSLAELWSIFDFLMPDYLFNYHYFKTHYESAIVKENDEKKQAELKRLVTPFILRRNKKEVLKELPDKIESTLTIHFDEEERKLYFAHLAQVNEELQAIAHMDHVDKIAILAMLTKLRQICCEPRVLFDNIEQRSSKFSACLELLHTLKENGQKVLLFSSFTSVLELLANALAKEGITYYQLTGQTSKEDRRDLVKQFQNDNTDVFLISLKAGGTGLNLTAAQAVIHFDPWWNLSAQNQATDRAYRIGQDKNVQVYKFIMKDSIEEKIQKLQDKKKNLADSFVENNDGSISTMSTDELISLFKI